MISINTETIRQSELDPEDFHALFPKVISQKYKLNMTSLSSYQLNAWDWKIIPSGRKFYTSETEIAEHLLAQRKMNNLAAFLAEDHEDGPSKNRHQSHISDSGAREVTEALSTILFRSIRNSQEHPWGIDVSEMDAFEEGKLDEVAKRFAESVVKWDCDGIVSVDSFLPELQAYLQPRNPFKAGSRFYWTKNVSDAFFDCGIVVVCPDFRNLVYIQFINDQ